MIKYECVYSIHNIDSVLEILHQIKKNLESLIVWDEGLIDEKYFYNVLENINNNKYSQIVIYGPKRQKLNPMHSVFKITHYWLKNLCYIKIVAYRSVCPEDIQSGGYQIIKLDKLCAFMNATGKLYEQKMQIKVKYFIKRFHSKLNNNIIINAKNARCGKCFAIFDILDCYKRKKCIILTPFKNIELISNNEISRASKQKLLFYALGLDYDKIKNNEDVKQIFERYRDMKKATLNKILRIIIRYSNFL